MALGVSTEDSRCSSMYIHDPPETATPGDKKNGGYGKQDDISDLRTKTEPQTVGSNRKRSALSWKKIQYYPGDKKFY